MNLSFLGKKASNSPENLLFLFPEKFELAENKAIDQQKNLVQGQHQKQVEDRIDEAPFLHTEKIQNRILDKKYGEAGAGKNHQNQNNLKQAFKFPLNL